MKSVDEIISEVETKWKEYLEMLPPEEKTEAIMKLLAGYLIRANAKITFLEKLKCFKLSN